jgi:hypothetical protein
MSAGAAGAAGAAAAAIAQAIKACGVLVRVEPSEFLNVVHRQQEPLVVRAATGFFTTNYMYLTSYKGLAFWTKANYELGLPPKCEVVTAGSISIPG